mmetsp:Transcript_42151/g.111090  ORF Transcript_42151/g.111090 Transcript_42151/m.111090 type:complete len:512 (-) Transcript_42151:50-1585(-)
MPSDWSSCQSLSWVAIIVLHVFQIYIHLGYLANYVSNATFLILALEVPLTLHMLNDRQVHAAARYHAQQWVAYCWILAGKAFVFFVAAVQHTDPNAFRGPKFLVFSVQLCALVFTFMMFRSTKQLFGRMSDRVSVASFLHTETVFYVMMDLVDTCFMLQYGRIQSEIHCPKFLDGYSNQIGTWKQICSVCVFLAIFFHAQSFPGADLIPQDFTGLGGQPMDEVDDGGEALEREQPPQPDGEGEDEWVASSHRTAADKAEAAAKRKEFIVVLARKRSVIVSILFVDGPFFFLRGYLAYLSTIANSPDYAMMMVKNLVGLFVHLVQYRILATAEDAVRHRLTELSYKATAVKQLKRVLSNTRTLDEAHSPAALRAGKAPPKQGLYPQSGREACYYVMLLAVGGGMGAVIAQRDFAGEIRLVVEEMCNSVRADPEGSDTTDMLSSCNYLEPISNKFCSVYTDVPCCRLANSTTALASVVSRAQLECLSELHTRLKETEGDFVNDFGFLFGCYPH